MLVTFPQRVDEQGLTTRARARRRARTTKPGTLKVLMRAARVDAEMMLEVLEVIEATEATEVMQVKAVKYVAPVQAIKAVWMDETLQVGQALDLQLMHPVDPSVQEEEQHEQWPEHHYHPQDEQAPHRTNEVTQNKGTPISRCKISPHRVKQVASHQSEAAAVITSVREEKLS